MVRRANRKRRGAVAVESAVVYSVLFLLLLGLIVGGLGVFRYEQVACQAREASRWAAVHGSDWEAENKQAAATKKQIFNTAVKPYATGMDVTKLTAQVELISGTTGAAYDWDAVAHAPTATTATGLTASNRVRVTVVYQWFPEVFLTGPVILKSVSEVPISY